MAFYGKVLQDQIEAEKQGKGYPYSQKDRMTLDEMFSEINRHAGTNFHYLAELDVYDVTGPGTIIARYLWKLETQTARAFLIPQLVSDRIKDCDKLVLDLYLDYIKSDKCTLDPERGPTASVDVRYDNAFRRLKPKRLKQQLLALAANPQDAYRLPFTMKMLASWKLPEMYDILLRYADGTNITPALLGFPEDTEQRRKRVAYVRRDLQFIAISGLKYYPTPETLSVIKVFTESPDIDIVLAAKKTQKVWKKYECGGTHMKRKLLITGFDAFGEAAINPSWEAVKLLPEEIGDFEVHKLEIPTVFGLATQKVLEKAAEIQPDVVLCVGQAGGRDAVTPERIGVNIRDAKIPDNTGNQPVGQFVAEEGPAAYFSTVPVMAMAQAIRDAQIPGAVSNSAGAFVCNDTLYGLLHHYAGTAVKVGFIHVPWLPEQGSPSLELNRTAAALEAAVRAC